MKSNWVPGEPWSDVVVEELAAELGSAVTNASAAVTGLSGKADTGHTHTSSDVSGLTASLNAKADISHAHAQSDVTGLPTLMTKLAGIEALADVTDAANVDAAGAVMNADTSTASMSFVVDEDAMTSNSATKVPTQQSVKAYVDSASTTAALPFINVKDYGAIGNGTADDTAALQAAFAATTNGKTLIIPPGIFTYAGLLMLPKNAILCGQGYGWQGSTTTSRLKATHADARIMTDDHSVVENLYIDGGGIAKWGIHCGVYTTSKPRFNNVRIADFTEAAWIFDATQNAILTNCNARSTPVGYYFVNGAANCDLFGCTFEYFGSSGGVNNRAILIENNLTDTRLHGAPIEFGGGCRDLRFWGGIYENGPGAYRIEILNTSTDYGGSIQFSGCQLSHSDNPTAVAMVHIGPDPGVFRGTDIIIENCMWSAGLVPTVIAESGRVKFRNHRQGGTGGKNTMGNTVLSGTATASYDEQTRSLIDSRFRTGLYANESFDWTTYATGTISWNATRKCADMFLPSTTAGIRAYFFGREGYAQQYGNITIRFKIAGANGPVRLNTWAPGNVMATVGVFDNGAHEVVHEFVGGETALVFTSDSGLDVNAELRYLICEHGGTGANSTVAAPTTSTAFTNTSTVTAAGTTTLTVDSTPAQIFTGTTTETVLMPTTSVLAGQQWWIVNNSTGTLAIQASGGSSIHSLLGGRAAVYTAQQDTPTGPSHWNFLFLSGATLATSSSTAMRDGNVNLTADAFIATATSTATAGGTTTLTINSAQTQVFTGSTTQTVLLPTTSVVAGMEYKIINQSSGIVTVQSSGANTITTVAAGAGTKFLALATTPTTAAHWRAI